MRKIKIKIQLEADRSLPTYQSKDAAGCDLIYSGEYPIQLLPLDRKDINTGVHIQLPEGYEAQVRGRSGLNKNHGIVVLTGTIDADYRGEIGVVVYNLSREPYIIKPGDRIAQLVIYNLSREPYIIKPGDRIAQLVICPVVQADWQQVEHLDKTDRGEGGFGSTGK